MRRRAASWRPRSPALPTDRSDADPDDETGTINEIPGVTMPIEIGETSSAELPVIKAEEKPPVITKPERAKPPNESRKKARAPGVPRQGAGQDAAGHPIQSFRGIVRQPAGADAGILQRADAPCRRTPAQ